MSLESGDDPEARQLALIREQKPIVAALRAVGYQIDFLFSPPPGAVPAAACEMLAQFLETPLSLETKLMISDLMDRAENPARAERDEPDLRDARDP